MSKRAKQGAHKKHTKMSGTAKTKFYEQGVKARGYNTELYTKKEKVFRAACTDTELKELLICINRGDQTCPYHTRTLEAKYWNAGYNDQSIRIRTKVGLIEYRGKKFSRIVTTNKITGVVKRHKVQPDFLIKIGLRG